MKYFISFILLCISNTAMPQTTTGKVIWYWEGSGNYTYTGELLNGKPDGIGLAISEGRGDTIIVGRFKKGMMHGRCVIRNIAGDIFAGSLIENTADGMIVHISPEKKFDYTTYTNGIMNGKSIMVGFENEITIGNIQNDKFNGRLIKVSSNGKSIYDNNYINSVKHGQGYQYEAATKEKFEGIWENGEWVRASTGNYPSFMRNSKLSGAVKSDHIYISSDFVRQGNMEQFHDTCFLYDTKNNNRWFGYWDRGEFRNGVIVTGDDIRTIGQFDAKRYKQGFCVEYKMDSYLHIGNYKDGKMDGDGITVDIKNSTIYDGIISADSYTGNAYRLMKNNEILIGNFNKGRLDGEGKTIFPDGRSVSGKYENGKLSFTSIKEVIRPDGKKVDINPKDINAAINFLLKEWDNNFSNINSGELSETESGYYSWYEVPNGFSHIKPDRPGIDGKPHHEFSSEISNHNYYNLVKSLYDRWCKELSACTITSLAKGKVLKLVPEINKLNEKGDFERIASFFTIPDYAGKKHDPQIRVMVENKGDAYRLTVDIISKWK